MSHRTADHCVIVGSIVLPFRSFVYQIYHLVHSPEYAIDLKYDTIDLHKNMMHSLFPFLTSPGVIIGQ